MSTLEERERQQNAVEQEKKERAKRNKKLAELRASNQMLEDAKENIREKLAADPEKMEEILDLVDNAQAENEQIARMQYNASRNDVIGAQYGEVSQYYQDKYKKHLENIGLTDEQVRAKSSDDAASKGLKIVASSDSKKEKDKKWFPFMKKKNEVNELGEEVITEIDQTKRVIAGDGYIPNEKNGTSPDKFMKDLAEKTDKKQEEQPIEQKNFQETKKNEPEINVNDKIEQNLGIKDRNKGGYEYPDFDPSAVSPLTRYDIIDLPSHGECYKHKKGRIPVRELTAADENLIASPNMYANGQLIETILRRCILDKNFNVDEMCPGDRDAVVLWLRATAYGPEYNVSTVNPENGKTYKSEINLSDFKYRDFNLKGDENGLFDYTFDNGDVAKFKILSYKELTKLQEDMALQYINQKKYIVYQKIKDIKYQVDEVFKDETGDDVLNQAIDYIYDWANNDAILKNEETLYSNFMTSSLIKRIVSINGSDDPKIIEDYINNLRITESKKIREYIFNNNPGIDFSLTISIPESDGGGSFESTFQYGETIFIS